MPRWRPVWRRPREAEVGDDFVLVVWDSCRFDAVEAARTPVLDRHGPVRRAYTHGTYTVPAHVAMFQGFLPHAFVDEPFYNRHVRQLWRIDARGLRTPPLVALRVCAAAATPRSASRRCRSSGMCRRSARASTGWR
jgi:hypothetical protein